MKIVVLGASGKAGSKIVEEALSRGLEVVAVVRESSSYANDKVAVIKKDAKKLTCEDIKGTSVIINATAAWSEFAEHVLICKHIVSLIKGTGIRFLVVGGASSLYTDDTYLTQLWDSPDFPAEWKPMANGQRAELAYLRDTKDVLWTFISPAADFDADGARTGGYKIGGEVMVLNSKGVSHISYADYAIAMIDEAISGAHLNRRINVCDL